jgi:hypothetical protein
MRFEEFQMSWDYEINTKLQIVEVVFEGGVTAGELHESSSELIKLEKNKGLIRFLVDSKNAEFAASLTDLYSLPTILYTTEDADRLGQVAVILPTSPKAKEAVEFYETAC